MVWAGVGGGGQIAGKTDVSAQNPALQTDKFEGTLASVQITCQTTDGKTGTVTLGSETFQLEQGALFLISKNGPAPTIKQMKLARLNLKPEGTLTLAQMTHDYFRNLAKSDPDIQAFWSAADKSK